jgi:hypothetical protein
VSLLLALLLLVVLAAAVGAGILVSNVLWLIPVAAMIGLVVGARSQSREEPGGAENARSAARVSLPPGERTR